MSRSAPEIARVLETVKAHQTLVTVYVADILFQSLLRRVDPAAGRIVLERSPVEAANEALLARPRCTFHSEVPGWHVEFVATEPRATTHEGAPAIQCRFPEVLVSHQRRVHGRGAAQPPLPLRCLADAGGITPFDARVIDIGLGGISFLLYAPGINLEPGTVLRGCRIEVPGHGVCVVDLEVRYSQPVTFAGGRRAMRSGCRFVNPTPEMMELASLYAK